MKEILKSIQDKIKRDVPEVKYIDVDYGQLNEENPPVKYPAAIIDIDSTNCEQMEEDGDNKMQRVTATIRITLAWQHTAPSNQASDSRSTALGYYDILGTVHTALQGYTDGEHFGALIRTRMSSRMSSKGLIEKDVYYDTIFLED